MRIISEFKKIKAKLNRFDRKMLFGVVAYLYINY